MRRKVIKGLLATSHFFFFAFLLKQEKTFQEYNLQIY